VCCSVLQCVAVCCSVLQCVALCCSVLQEPVYSQTQAAVRNNGSVGADICVLQYVAVCCSVLQCFVKFSTRTRRQRRATMAQVDIHVLQCVAVC